jgi:hypothetical protein
MWDPYFTLLFLLPSLCSFASFSSLSPTKQPKVLNHSRSHHIQAWNNSNSKIYTQESSAIKRVFTLVLLCSFSLFPLHNTSFTSLPSSPFFFFLVLLLPFTQIPLTAAQTSAFWVQEFRFSLGSLFFSLSLLVSVLLSYACVSLLWPCVGRLR